MNNNLWAIPFAGYMLTTTVAALLQRTFVTKTNLDPYVSGLVRSTLVGLPFILVFATLTGGAHFVQGVELVVAVIYAFIYAAYNRVSFYAIKHTDAATYATLIKLHVLLVIFAGTVFLGESLDSRQFVGMIIMLIASMLLGKVRLSRHQLGYIAASTVLLAAMVVLERYVVGHSQPGPAILTTFSTSYLAVAILGFKKVRNSRLHIREELPAMLKLSLVTAPMPALLLLATAMAGNVSMTSALATIKVVLVTIGAYFFLGERDHARVKLAAAVLTVIGALML